MQTETAIVRVGIVLSIVGSLMFSQLAKAQYPTAAQVQQQAMAKALAEKERNDRIVAKQRAEEKAAKEKANSSPSSSDKTKATEGKKGK